MTDYDFEPPLQERLAYTKREAARAIGVSTRTIEEEIRRGRLKRSKVGTKVIISRERLIEYLRERETA